MEGKVVSVLFHGVAEGGKVYEEGFTPNAIAGGIYYSRLITELGDIRYNKLLMTR